MPTFLIAVLMTTTREEFSAGLRPQQAALKAVHAAGKRSAALSNTTRDCVSVDASPGLPCVNMQSVASSGRSDSRDARLDDPSNGYVLANQRAEAGRGGETGATRKKHAVSRTEEGAVGNGGHCARVATRRARLRAAPVGGGRAGSHSQATLLPAEEGVAAKGGCGSGGNGGNEEDWDASGRVTPEDACAVDSQVDNGNADGASGSPLRPSSDMPAGVL